MRVTVRVSRGDEIARRERVEDLHLEVHRLVGLLGSPWSGEWFTGRRRRRRAVDHY